MAVTSGIRLELDSVDRAQIRSAAIAVCAPLGGQTLVFFSDEPTKVAIFCSKQDHCLLDLVGTSLLSVPQDACLTRPLSALAVEAKGTGTM